jgi:Zn-dependent oligopeptidase
MQPEPLPDDLQQASIGDVVEALIEMRDSLTRVSLMLQDLYFAHNADQRKAAEESITRLLARL